MAYELLSQSRKLTKAGGEGGRGGGAGLGRGLGGYKNVLKKTKPWGRLFMREVIRRLVI